MMNLLIRGVRNNVHSVSMVNQFLMLGLYELGGVDVWHEDLPSRWPVSDCGFNPQDRDLIASVPAPVAGDHFDAVLSFDCADLIDPRLDPAITYHFTVTEFGQFKDEGVARMRALMEQGAHVMTPSRWSAQRVIDRYGDALADQVVVIPHGINTRYYQPHPEAQRSVSRQALGIAEHEFVFLNLGAGTWNKGIDVLLKGFDRLLASGRQARLILKDMRSLYGDKLNEVARQLVQKGAISASTLERVMLFSNQLDLRQIASLYNIADCYVSPYRAEGFNLPVLEALACGTPAIATRDGATKEFADASVAYGLDGVLTPLPAEAGQGCYIEPSLEHLCSLMQQCVDQDVKRSGVFAAGLAEIPRRFNWTEIARQHVVAFS